MITNSNQVCFVKMTDRGLQEGVLEVLNHGDPSGQFGAFTCYADCQPEDTRVLSVLLYKRRTIPILGSKKDSPGEGIPSGTSL
jgi:hypothetical protein